MSVKPNIDFSMLVHPYSVSIRDLISQLHELLSQWQSLEYKEIVISLMS